MASRKYSAVVEIGGAVAGSFKTVSQTVRGDFSKIGDSIRDIKRQQEAVGRYDQAKVQLAETAREHRELTRNVRDLERAQRKVAKPTAAMRKELLYAQRAAAKAGKAHDAQRRKLDKLGGELTEAGVDTSRLTHEQANLATALGKTERKMKALQGVADAGVGKAFRKTASDAGQLAVGVGAVVGTLGAAVTMANKTTAEQENLAKALGVSGVAFSAWGGLAKEAGFEADHVGDLIEEMNNKLGESAGLEEITPVKESLEILGLAFEDIVDLAPEEQFRTIAKAIKEMDDQQAAVSAADILMGGEANKFFGYLRSRKEGVDELLDQQKRLNVLTDAGREGARKYNAAVGHFTTVVGSATQEVAGLIGGALAPYVEDIGPQFSAWLNDHRGELEGFAKGLGEALPKIGDFAFSLLSVVQQGAAVIGTVADMVGGFENLAMIVGGAMMLKTIGNVVVFTNSVFSAGAALAPLISTALPGLVAGIKAVGLAVMANPIGLVIGAAVLAIGRLIAKWDELKAAFTDGGIGSAVASFFGFGDDEPEDAPVVKTQKAVASIQAQEVPEMTAPGYTPGMVPQGFTPPRLQGAGVQQAVTHVRQENTFTIHAAEGMDVDEIADVVAARLKEIEYDAGRAAFHDGGY